MKTKNKKPIILSDINDILVNEYDFKRRGFEDFWYTPKCSVYYDSKYDSKLGKDYHIFKVTLYKDGKWIVHFTTNNEDEFLAYIKSGSLDNLFRDKKIKSLLKKL